ncbi:MAG: helix-turn-helix domain-containing protein [Deltaproteobacteria bacterium]|nr:helix-turn-helix domain-containing protein [Deltaproteobacteria bacterium]
MDRISKVRALREQGQSIASIARQCGISRPTVYAYLNKQAPVATAPAPAATEVEPILNLLAAVCELARRDDDQEFLAPLQAYAIEAFIERDVPSYRARNNRGLNSGVNRALSGRHNRARTDMG